MSSGPPTFPTVDRVTKLFPQPTMDALAALFSGGGSGGVASVNGKTGIVVLTASDVDAQPSGSYVSDDELASAISAITLSALGGVPTSRTVAGHVLSSNVTLVKADVGLGSVDNTTDASKPVSVAQAAADSAVLAASVQLTGTQTVAGVKTFSASPVVPAPTNPTDAATKKYVDDNAGGGGGAVSSVNGKTGVVVLVPSDIGAATSAQGAKADTALQSAPVTSVAGKTGVVTLAPSDVGAATVAQGAKADTALQSAPVTSVAGKTGVVTLVKGDVGLGSVDNTADASKSFTRSQISDATTVGKAVLGAVDAPTARTAIGAGTGNGTSNLVLGTTTGTAYDGALGAAKYTKPGTGIPSTDMTTTVQTSLGKADSSTQGGVLPGTGGPAKLWYSATVAGISALGAANGDWIAVP